MTSWKWVINYKVNKHSVELLLTKNFTFPFTDTSEQLAEQILSIFNAIKRSNIRK